MAIFHELIPVVLVNFVVCFALCPPPPIREPPQENVVLCALLPPLRERVVVDHPCVGVGGV